MRNIILIFFAGMSLSAAGQARYGDGPMPKFFVEGSFQGGEFAENFNMAPLTSGYQQVLNPASGNVTFTNYRSFTYAARFGYYFNRRKRNLGVGIGLQLTTQAGSVQTDSFHAEFQANDYKGNVFRQVVTSSGNISESVKSTAVNIPVFLKYKISINNDMYVSIDAGILYNLLEQSKYNANASFDYEAIYKISGSGTNLTYYYDNSPIPGGNDWKITQAEFIKDNPDGNVQNYFNSLKAVGYGVGLGDQVKKSGTVQYKGQAVGALLQPAINYKLREGLYLMAGLYASFQSFSNSSYKSSNALTTGPGQYTSLLSFGKTMEQINYGVHFGLNYTF